MYSVNALIPSELSKIRKRAVKIKNIADFSGWADLIYSYNAGAKAPSPR